MQNLFWVGFFHYFKAQEPSSDTRWLFAQTLEIFTVKLDLKIEKVLRLFKIQKYLRDSI